LVPPSTNFSSFPISHPEMDSREKRSHCVIPKPRCKIFATRGSKVSRRWRRPHTSVWCSLTEHESFMSHSFSMNRINPPNPTPPVQRAVPRSQRPAPPLNRFPICATLKTPHSSSWRLHSARTTHYKRPRLSFAPHLKDTPRQGPKHHPQATAFYPFLQSPPRDTLKKARSGLFRGLYHTVSIIFCDFFCGPVDKPRIHVQ